jgi:hypothetical protein
MVPVAIPNVTLFLNLAFFPHLPRNTARSLLKRHSFASIPYLSSFSLISSSGRLTIGCDNILFGRPHTDSLGAHAIIDERLNMVRISLEPRSYRLLPPFFKLLQ